MIKGHLYEDIRIVPQGYPKKPLDFETSYKVQTTAKNRTERTGVVFVKILPRFFARPTKKYSKVPNAVPIIQVPKAEAPKVKIAYP